MITVHYSAFCDANDLDIWPIHHKMITRITLLWTKCVPNFNPMLFRAKLIADTLTASNNDLMTMTVDLFL